MNDAEDRTDSRKKWAEDRTDWAEDRTILASERTFAGWLRTGMSSVALALGMKVIFGNFDPTWGAKAIATIFIAVALYIFWMARRQACRTLSRMQAHDSKAQTVTRVRIMSWSLSAGTVATGVALWLL